MIEQPLADLDAWVEFYSQAELPVLRRTMATLDKMRDNAINVNGRVLAATILQDPLMTLRVLAYIQENRSKKQNADITTIDRALIMLGVDPFFSAFADPPLAEDRLKGHPKALLGLVKVVTRARKAALWAREWAILRHDLDVEEITVATLLHEVSELLMWSFAPKLALEVQRLQAQDPTLRSVTAQEAVYGVSLRDLQLALIRAWHLPGLLATLLDDSDVDNPRILNVSLATALARHSADGWNNPALPFDFEAIEKLLRISHRSLLDRMGLNPGEVEQAISDARQTQ